MLDFSPYLRLQNIFADPTLGTGGDFTDPNTTLSPFQNINFGANTNLNNPGLTTTAPPVSTPPDTIGSGALGDLASRIAQFYKPKHEAQDTLSDMIAAYPQQEKPSWGRALLGALGALNVTPGPAWKGVFGAPNHEVGMAIADEPNKSKLLDWKNRVSAQEKAATLEKDENNTQRQAAYEAISTELRAEAENHKVQKNEADAKIKQQRADIYEFKAKNPGMKLIYQKGGNVQAFDPISRKTIDTGVPTGTLSQMDQMNLGHDNKMEEIDATNKGKEKIEGMKESSQRVINENRGWQAVNIPDPNDPTKTIAVRMNTATGEVQPITLNGQGVGPLSKPGTNTGGITNSTKTMMEGASMLRPHINDLRTQAADLEKRGLFGPVMSRVRDWAAKVGTTGDANQVQSSFENFTNNLANDPRINPTNDRVVGQFLLNLGLMASGAGRVHGGARGGGSIQMINYMKSLLSSSSTLDMFNGRLDTLDDYMKGYSEGPIAKTSLPKSKIDQAIDDILSGVKSKGVK